MEIFQKDITVSINFYPFIFKLLSADRNCDENENQYTKTKFYV